MKKILSVLLCAALCGAAILGTAACGGEEDRYSVYAPDGAPALALASLLAEEETKNAFDVHIVDANSIQTYVTAKADEDRADFCILPVNAAAKLLGTGEDYQMLGTVTHGNLYFLKDGTKTLPDITAENIAEVLPGKQLGVIQYDNVPGLTLRVVLDMYDVEYTVVSSGKNLAENKVNIRPCTPKEVVPATGCDYYLCPEPAATSKVGATQGKLAAAGSLQTLYGENGYPQAALVAKKSVIEEDKETVDKVIASMQRAEEYLKTADAATLNSLLEGKRTAGMEAAFTEAQLNAKVIANCSVRYESAAAGMSKVVAFLMNCRTIAPASTDLPQEAFFYAG